MAKAPTATNASSLTTDSNAMASIMPSWCSVTSILRVPTRIVKTGERGGYDQCSVVFSAAGYRVIRDNAEAANDGL